MAEKRREILPPELAALVDVAERPRTENWSLRAALTRYAQPEPLRVSKLLDPVRRLESALGAHTDTLRKDGPAVWEELQGDSDATAEGADPDRALLLGLLGAAAEIDRLGDALAAWAVNREGDRPDTEVDSVTADVEARLDALGVPHEERLPPSARPQGRRRG